MSKKHPKLCFSTSKEALKPNRILWASLNISLEYNFHFQISALLDGWDKSSRKKWLGWKSVELFCTRGQNSFQIPECQVEAQVVFQSGELSFTWFNFFHVWFFLFVAGLFNHMFQGEEFPFMGLNFYFSVNVAVLFNFVSFFKITIIKLPLGTERFCTFHPNSFPWIVSTTKISICVHFGY